MECYERDFEEFMLKDTAEYYRRKAAVWIQVRAVQSVGRAAKRHVCYGNFGGSSIQHLWNGHPLLPTPSALLPFVPAFFSCFPPAFFCRRTAPPTTSSRRRSA
jgi:hypothetical protein